MLHVLPVVFLTLFCTKVIAQDQSPFVKTEKEMEKALQLEVKPSQRTFRGLRGPIGIVDDQKAEIGGFEAQQQASAVIQLNFAFGSARIMPDSFETLDNLGRVLKRNNEAKVRVEGHTDSVGSEYDNQILSEERAQSVIRYLVRKHGIEKQRLTMRGFGESRPMSSNGTEEGRAMNRRVVIVRTM